MRKAIIAILISIALIGAALLVERSVRLNGSSASREDGKVLPTHLKLRDFKTGQEVSFDKYAGKALLINFWASWCEACMAEMPSIQKLYDTLKGQGLEVLAVNVDESPEKVVPSIVSKLGLSFPVFTDADGELSQAFEVLAIPFSVVTDRDHKIVWSESGERDWSSSRVTEEMQKLLK